MVTRAARCFLLVLLTTASAPAGLAQTFTQTASLTGTYFASVAWGDYDNDGDLDLLLTGGTSTLEPLTFLYENRAGSFVEIPAGLPGVKGSGTWADYDNDGDLDILLLGYVDPPDSGSIPFARLYRNDRGHFVEVPAGLPQSPAASPAWGDYDNDGDLDLLLVGQHTAVYANTGGFFHDVATSFPDLTVGSAAWGDFDGDGDADLLLTGSGNDGIRLMVYRNDAAALIDSGALFGGGIDRSAVAWGDYDNDGDLDMLVTGHTGLWYSVTSLYRNDAGVFHEVAAGFPGVYAGSVAWGDFDNDGDLDVLLAGFDDSGSSAVAMVYRNDGGGVFTDIGAGLAGGAGHAAWADFDNDGDLDIVQVGGGVLRVFRNDGGRVNTLPTAPGGLAATVDGNRVALSWNTASDAETPAPGLTYNLRVGRIPGASDVMSASAADDGYRRVPALGNVPHGTTAWVGSLAPGTYYWSVQAVDTAFAGSAFAPEESFVVSCNYSFGTPGATLPTGGATGTIAVSTGAGCPVVPARSAGWISITGTPGSGPTAIDYFVQANDGSPRSGSISVGGATFTIDQAGCSATTDKHQDTFAASGGYGTVNVAASAACHWTATTDADWMTGFGFGYPHQGNGSVSYTVPANAGPARSATITVGVQTVRISQTKALQSIWHNWFGVHRLETPYVGDFNGDHLTDIITFTRQNPLAVGDVYVALSNGRGHFVDQNGNHGSSDKWHDWFAISADEQVVIGDFDGDGKDDIVTFATDSPTAYGDVYVAVSDGTHFVDQNGTRDSSTKWHDWFAIRQTEQVRIGDANGDLTDDFFTFLPSPFAQCYTVRSLGNRMGDNALWPEAVAPRTGDVPFVGDVNGDGKADIITFAQGEGKVYVSIGS